MRQYNLVIAICAIQLSYMKKLAFYSLLSAALIAASSVFGESTPPTAGDWVWIINDGLVLKVIVLKDGTCVRADALDKGTWRLIPDTGLVEFKWGNGAIDKISAKKSKSVLEGSNSGGDKIVAVKLP